MRCTLRRSNSTGAAEYSVQNSRSVLCIFDLSPVFPQSKVLRGSIRGWRRQEIFLGLLACMSVSANLPVANAGNDVISQGGMK